MGETPKPPLEASLLARAALLCPCAEARWCEPAHTARGSCKIGRGRRSFRPSARRASPARGHAQGKTMIENNTGRFVWYELLTTDPKAAIAFYGEVVGWKAQPYEGADYHMWVGSQGPLGGTMVLPEQAKQMGAPPHWTSNVEVADVDKTVARVRELGGRVYVEPNDIPKIGRFAVIADPQGATISVFKPADTMASHDSAKHGEFCWNELITTDQNAAFAFYHEIFGWERPARPRHGPHGRLPHLRAQRPAARRHVQQAQGDADAAVVHVLRAGRRPRRGARPRHQDGRQGPQRPMVVPGGARIVQLMDPQGAAFALHERPAATPAS